MTGLKIPQGWKLIGRRDCPCGHEAIVLCEKADDRQDDTQYVTWEADLRMGGCYHGRYTESLEQAKLDLANRRV